MSKTTIRKLSDKAVTKIFVDRLVDFLCLWQVNAPEKRFDEFLLESTEEGAPAKKMQRIMYCSFARVVKSHIDMWQAVASEKPFDLWLQEVKAGIHK